MGSEQQGRRFLRVPPRLAESLAVTTPQLVTAVSVVDARGSHA